jgi:hypothetical protein
MGWDGGGWITTPTTQATSTHTVITHQDLILLVNWMADEDYEVQRILDAVAKPWNWTEELKQAKADLTGRAS